jgi:energy-coupling factor transport system permease protein
MNFRQFLERYGISLSVLAVLALIASVYYRSARIPFSAVKLNWAYIAFFISFVVIANTLLTGGELRGYTEDQLHIYFRLPIFGTPISAESMTYALAQYVRFFSMAAVGFPIAYAMAPGDIGPAFARLRIPDKFAYAIELTWRFLPSLAADMRDTIDAQRVRGYEWEKVGRGPVGKLKRAVPLMVPVTMNAITGAEDTIDAMDLRAFGTGPRTWLRRLAMDRTDRLTLAGFGGVLVGITALSQLGYTVLWVPEILAGASP